MTTPAAPTPAGPATGREPAEDARTAPRADCVADPEGGVALELTLPHGTAGPVLLLLRLRGEPDEVRLPLTPDVDGRPRAVLPASTGLAEGRWDAHAEYADGTAVRLEAGLNDLRALVDRASRDIRGPVEVRIPYATKHGNLTVRTWLRAPHAEAGELHIDDEGLRLSGRLHGAALTADARVEAVARHDPAVAVHAGTLTEGTAFRCRLTYADLSEGLWDLWLRPSGDDGPAVRIARLLDDVADKKQIFTYPGVTLGGGGEGGGVLEAVPYYTTDNGLSVKVTTTG